MRLLGMILALGVIVWVMVQASGGADSESVIAKGHQEALEKAQSLETQLQQKATLQALMKEPAQESSQD